MDLLRNGVGVLVRVVQRNDNEIRLDLVGDFFVYRMEMVCLIFLYWRCAYLKWMILNTRDGEFCVHVNKCGVFCSRVLSYTSRAIINYH